jgi:transcriptional regulator NrdR family protein
VKAFLFQKRYFDLQEQFFHTKPLSKNIMVIHSDMHVERFDKKKVEKTVKELLLKKCLTKEEIAKISGGVRRKICELYKKRVSTQEIREIIYMKLTKMGLQMRNLPYKSASDYSLFRTATQYPLDTISGKDIARLFKYIIFLENTKEWHPLF